MNDAQKAITETVRPVNLTPRQVENFWKKIKKGTTPDACWEWLGYKDTNGYGKCGTAHRKIALAHRVAYVLTNGEPPTDKPFLLHKCDNPGCVNPLHIFPGTQADNIADMIKKRRNNQWARQSRPEDFRGEKNCRAKMTPEQVIEIRKLRESGKTLIRIAERFQMSIPGVHHIINRKCWNHIP